MPMVYSQLLGHDVDNASEEWRHECECRSLLNSKPTRTEKHLHLYGVSDRADLFRVNSSTGLLELREDHHKLWPKDERGRAIKPIMGWRGIESADRILADAKKLYDLQQPK